MRHQRPALLISLLSLYSFTSASTSSSPNTSTPQPEKPTPTTPWHLTSIAHPPQTIVPHLAQFILEHHASLSSATYTPPDDSPNETFAPRAVPHQQQDYAFDSQQNALRDPRPNIHAMPQKPSFNSDREDSDPNSDSEGMENDVVKRQQGGIGGGAEYTATPTQMPTVWTYYLGGPVPITYTQLFSPTPDPWAGPQSGSIGLGTIQGTVGAVRGH